MVVYKEGTDMKSDVADSHGLTRYGGSHGTAAGHPFGCTRFCHYEAHLCC